MWSVADRQRKPPIYGSPVYGAAETPCGKRRKSVLVAVRGLQVALHILYICDVVKQSCWK